MRELVLILHIITSLLACFITGTILVRAIGGLANRLQLNKLDVKLPFVATLLLYLQFVLGTFLFVMYMLEFGSGEVTTYAKQVVKGRFWAVEHFILMVFTLVMSHIGWVFAKSNHTPRLIFKKNFLYFGIACAMILISMAMNIVRYAM
ncbi:hypothetical protein KEM09_03785 [Carboxylicivirga mesophila]|uniref:Uncharacterized protein n=1 Tax=Carboxylicivirga mesophila TaxID=1166478 RepID=A0ABS5K6B6_9BACT|nr:hypothetical protein [Carboxylicivirga mesophila]MBS2210505.1 hypothetical protein [Carboxylicivirga mesophila]